MDSRTFDARWLPINRMPPMETRVPTTRILEPRPEPQADPPKAGARAQHRARVVKRSSDLCSRHNRKKTYISRYKWRCL